MDFVGILTIFVLAIYVGWEVITKVPPILHTPLMSGSNAISGITIVGALLSAGGSMVANEHVFLTIPGLEIHLSLAKLLGFLAVIFATINVVGGFLVTHRMLEMFKRKD